MGTARSKRRKHPAIVRNAVRVIMHTASKKNSCVSSSQTCAGNSETALTDAIGNNVYPNGNDQSRRLHFSARARAWDSVQRGRGAMIRPAAFYKTVTILQKRLFLALFPKKQLSGGGARREFQRPPCRRNSVPATMHTVPAMTCHDSFSCRNRIPKTTTSATLNLSMGATLETSPHCSALK